MKRALPVVQKLIAAPCDVPWASMKGDERVRHCGECDRDVHNLSAMPKDELQSFLRALVDAPDNALLPCISLYQRQDGTVLLEDCPVGLRARRRRALLTSTLGLGGVAVAALTALAFLHHRDASTKATPEPVAIHAVESAEPVPSAIVAQPAMDTSTLPGFVTIDGPTGTEVFEGARRLGSVPVSVQATPGDHTYRARFQGKDEVFALNVGANSCAHHVVALGAKPVPPPVGTGNNRPHVVPVAGRIAWHRDRK